jgi:hypothetical protein
MRKKEKEEEMSSRDNKNQSGSLPHMGFLILLNFLNLF